MSTQELGNETSGTGVVDDADFEHGHNVKGGGGLKYHGGQN